MDPTSIDLDPFDPFNFDSPITDSPPSRQPLVEPGAPSPAQTPAGDRLPTPPLTDQPPAHSPHLDPFSPAATSSPAIAPTPPLSPKPASKQSPPSAKPTPQRPRFSAKESVRLIHELVPLDLCLQHAVAPLSFENQILLLGMIAPQDSLAITRLQHHLQLTLTTPYRVRTSRIADSLFQRLIAAYRTQHPSPSPSPDTQQPPPPSSTGTLLRAPAASAPAPAPPSPTAPPPAANQSPPPSSPPPTDRPINHTLILDRTEDWASQIAASDGSFDSSALKAAFDKQRSSTPDSPSTPPSPSQFDLLTNESLSLAQVLEQRVKQLHDLIRQDPSLAHRQGPTMIRLTRLILKMQQELSDTPPPP